MHAGIFNFLRNYSSDTFKVNSIIISGYIRVNGIENVLNREIRRHLIIEGSEDEAILETFIALLPAGSLDFEGLIELFEFVISPSDKIVNGAIYTPKYIREYIVNQCMTRFGATLDQIKIADISCGCGGFLLTAVEKIKSLTNKPFHKIFSENIFGIDITKYSVDRAKLLLSLLAILNNEDQEDFGFNFFIGDSLVFNWRQEVLAINQHGGFDLIVGNPPYVASRNMDIETLRLLRDFAVARTGHPDLYIPFFQIGLENLNETGILGYITVNTFIKSINGRALREYFATNDINLILLNFGGEQVFHDRNTYTCICFLSHGNGGIDYLRLSSNELEDVNLANLLRFNYVDLNHHDGWNLVNEIQAVNFINSIENTGIPFKDLYNTKNGIATLKNDVYKFKPVFEDDHFYYLEDNGQRFPIEVEICRDIINANKLKVIDDIDRLREKIIFPYDDRTVIIPEDTMRATFPQAYRYLNTKRQILSGRDKSTGDYEAWYAYGRRQSMDIHAYKLFFPHICDRPNFVLCEEMDLLFYNGMAIVSNNLEDLRVIKKIMESDLFFKYISSTTKDYSSGYISMSRNYLKNFGVFQLSAEQRAVLLELDDVNEFLEELYELNHLQMI